MSDPYVYTGTTVLKNKKEFTNPHHAEKLERLKSLQRFREPPPQVSISYDGYKKLHHHIFQDIYDWAGKPRTVNIAKKDMFCLAPHIDKQMKERFALIQKENNLKNLGKEEFAERAAEHICEINAIHPFREGNGRALRLFLEVLANQAGHKISMSRIDPAKWMDASLKGFNGDYRPMKAVIQEAMLERSRERSKSVRSYARRSRQRDTDRGR